MGDRGRVQGSGPLPVPAETVSLIYLTAYRIALYPVIIQRLKAKTNDLSCIDMGSKPPPIKVQVPLPGDFAERHFYRFIDSRMGTVHLRK